MSLFNTMLFNSLIAMFTSVGVVHAEGQLVERSMDPVVLVMIAFGVIALVVGRMTKKFNQH